MHHWLVRLSNSAVFISKRREATEAGTKREIRGVQRGSDWWGDVKDKAEGRKLTCYLQ